MEHAHGKTTEIYTHVSTKGIGKIRSPLDGLKLDEKGKKIYNLVNLNGCLNRGYPNHFGYEQVI